MAINKISVTLEVGGTDTLVVTVLPDNTDDKTVTFTSSDEVVATVTPKQGKITAIAPGTAKVIATTVNGLTAECNVTVSEPTTPPEETK